MSSTLKSDKFNGWINYGRNAGLINCALDGGIELGLHDWVAISSMVRSLYLIAIIWSSPHTFYHHLQILLVLGMPQFMCQFKEPFTSFVVTNTRKEDLKNCIKTEKRILPIILLTSLTKSTNVKIAQNLGKFKQQLWYKTTTIACHNICLDHIHRDKKGEPISILKNMHKSRLTFQCRKVRRWICLDTSKWKCWC